MERVSIHPCGVAHVLDLFPSEAKAHRTMARLRSRRMIRHIGTAQVRPEGRPRDVYFNGRPPQSDQFVHEYHLTTFCLLYPDAAWQRLEDTDRTVRPDAEMRMSDGSLYYVEFHTGSVRNHDRIEKRFHAYQHSTSDVLWVCLQERHVETLRQFCSNSRMYFTSLDAVERDPFGSVWRDREGHLCELA